MTTSPDQLTSLPVRIQAAVDAGDIEAFAATLADDVICEIVIDDALPTIIAGREALVAMTRASVADPRRAMHFVGGVDVIELNGDRARLRSSGLNLSIAEQGITVTGLCRYEDDIIRQDGIWRIAHRRARILQKAARSSACPS